VQFERSRQLNDETSGEKPDVNLPRTQRIKVAVSTSHQLPR
jgi:hypothetical protein